VAGDGALLGPFAVTGVRAHEAAGRPDAAARWLDEVIRAVGPVLHVVAPAIDHATGLVRLADGSVVAARERLEAAVRGWDERGRQWEALWARLALAGALQRSSRYADAMELVRHVRGIAEGMGSAPLVARADELSRVARGRGAELDLWHPLTTREFEVAQCISGGMTNVEIADALYISPKTAAAHVEHILAKLGATRRAQIATWTTALTTTAAGPSAPSGTRGVQPGSSLVRR
jgi:DNA-binding CsgD family transcriptional regulator